MNLQNMLFSPRETAELRLHTATTNPQKMVNWLFIFVAILKYAETNVDKIIKTNEPISIAEVLNYYKEHFSSKEGTFLSEYLIAYFEDRKKVFKMDKQRGDRVSEHDMINDKTFKFQYKGISDLF